MKLTRLLALCAASLLPACATIFEGTSESMAVNTTPAGATCNVDREGTRLGTVSPTPGSINVSKSKNDVTVSCILEGYKPAQVSVSPKFVGTTFGNIIIGGLVGVAVDAASGANFDLPDKVELTLAPDTPPVANTPAPTAPQPVIYAPSAPQPGQPGA